MYDGCMTNVEHFSNGPIEGRVRVIMDKEGRVWMVLSDMTKMLDYSTTAHAVRLLKPHQYRPATDEERALLNIPGGRAPYLVTEGGFYRLALRSSRPEAEKFQDWVEEEVLTSIRSKGGYIGENASSEDVKALVKEHNEKLRSLEAGAKQFFERNELEHSLNIENEKQQQLHLEQTIDRQERLYEEMVKRMKLLGARPWDIPQIEDF